jgi:methionine-S-sulfoxide reductase
VGYAGGNKQHPIYYDLGDHTECVQIDFDPRIITYEQLLAIFWASHNPCARNGDRQYMSAVFYHDETQKNLGLKTRDREADRRGARITAEILPVKTFTVAEAYHQKYLLREEPKLLRDFQAAYPDPRDFINSTAAARVNGYLAGHGSKQTLESDFPQLGLSAEASELLRRLWERAK